MFNLDKFTAIRELHSVLLDYKEAEARFMEIECKRSVSLDTWSDEALTAEYDAAMKIWDEIEYKAYSLANIISNNAFTYKCFDRLISLHTDELIAMTE